MAPGNLETLVKKVKAIARGPHADLLEKLIYLLYERQHEPEYFSPEDLAAIAKGKAQIAPGGVCDPGGMEKRGGRP
uniref:Uncharacterized protein n=1 Tax=Desulfobacca acetoxidans TaxID=60893 RepID=A0A7V4GA61_9BACT